MSSKDITIRFSVGKKGGKCSSVWNLFFDNPDKDNAKSDVYLMYPSLGGILKLSIHESGDIRYSYTSEFWKDKDIRNALRHLDKWSLQHNETIFKIIVPYTELMKRVCPDGKKVEYLPSPNKGNATEIFLYITKESLLSELPDEFSLFREERLANGNILSLIWRPNPITKENQDLYLPEKSKALDTIKEKEITGKELRGYFFLNNDGKERGFIDLAFKESILRRLIRLLKEYIFALWHLLIRRRSNKADGEAQ